MACSLSILGWSAAVPRERRKLFPNVPSRSTTSVDKLFNSGAIGFSFPHEVNPQLRSNCIVDGPGDPIKRQIHFSFKRYLIFETNSFGNFANLILAEEYKRNGKYHNIAHTLQLHTNYEITYREKYSSESHNEIVSLYARDKKLVSDLQRCEPRPFIIDAVYVIEGLLSRYITLRLLRLREDRAPLSLRRRIKIHRSLKMDARAPGHLQRYHLIYQSSLFSEQRLVYILS